MLFRVFNQALMLFVLLLSLLLLLFLEAINPEVYGGENSPLNKHFPRKKITKSEIFAQSSPVNYSLILS